MSELFEFFSKNPFLIILLLGALTGLFRKKSPENEQKKKRQQQRQPAQRTPTQQHTNTQSSYPEREEYRQESKPKQVQQKPSFDWDMDVFGEQIEELEKKVRDTMSPYKEKKKVEVSTIQSKMKDEVKELSIKGQEIAQNSPILNQELQLSEGKVVNSRHRVKPGRVVEGVMWSEILGQPRSRNPHRPVYSEHFSSGRKR